FARSVTYTVIPMNTARNTNSNPARIPLRRFRKTADKTLPVFLLMPISPHSLHAIYSYQLPVGRFGCDCLNSNLQKFRCLNQLAQLKHRPFLSVTVKPIRSKLGQRRVGLVHFAP